MGTEQVQPQEEFSPSHPVSRATKSKSITSKFLRLLTGTTKTHTRSESSGDRSNEAATAAGTRSSKAEQERGKDSQVGELSTSSNNSTVVNSLQQPTPSLNSQLGETEEEEKKKKALRGDQNQMDSQGTVEVQVEKKESTGGTLMPKPSMRRKSLQVDINERKKVSASPSRSLKSPGSPERALYLLKLAKLSHMSGDKPSKTLDYASRASKLFEKSSSGGWRPSLELVMSLHIMAAALFRMGKYHEAVEGLEKTLESIGNGDRQVQGGGVDNEDDPMVESEYLLAAFAGYMQLGDAYSRLGKQGKALECYRKALESQKRAAGETDPQVGETCRYLAEANLQAMRFTEAEEHCEQVLRIHAESSPAGCMEEAGDRRLMALIKSGKGEHEAALEHLILASTATSSKEDESSAETAASIDASIGDCYAALGRYEEAVFSYQKAMHAFKQLKGESHVSVASIYVSLGELAASTGKLREARSYCEKAVRIYGKKQPQQQQTPEEVAAGLTDIAAVYEALNEREQAIRLLQKALDTMQRLAPGDKRAAAGIEAQMGVLYYIMGDSERALSSLSNSVSKLNPGGGGGEGEVVSTPTLGVLLNQLGLVLFELGRIEQGVEALEQAKVVLVEACGVHHPDTIAVCSNLAGGYDALGRVEEAIDLLDRVVRFQEERLGTVHPDVVDQRSRLDQMVRQSGKPLVRKTNTLEELLMLPRTQSKRFHHHRLAG